MISMSDFNMREILFRGKRADNGEWVQGFYFVEAGHFIKELPSCVSTSTYLVLPETICQYTGLRDGNGNKVFEGDILQYYERIFNGADICKYAPVEFIEGGFTVDKYYLCNWLCNGMYGNIKLKDITIVGNIYDNPEVLK